MMAREGRGLAGLCGDIHTPFACLTAGMVTACAEDEAQRDWRRFRSLLREAGSTLDRADSGDSCAEGMHMAPALLKQVVAERLQSAEDDDVDAARSVSEVRQGPLANVVVDRKAHGGGLSMCHRGLHLESRGEFVTARSKSGFLRGCWVYEATMHTGGHAHVGFVTSHCIHHLSDLNGVGDTALSVAFDGHRSCKWTRNKAVPFGENWAPGDVVACALDLESGHVEFFLNGASLGVAFANLPRSGLVYYPALSLAHAERCTLNFGALPLQFVYRNSQTQRLYQAMEPPPPAASIRTAEFLASALERICTATVNPAHCRPDPPQDLMGLCDKILGVADWTEPGNPPVSHTGPPGHQGRVADAAPGTQRLWAKGFAVGSWAVQATEAVTGPLLAVVLGAAASAQRYLTQVYNTPRVPAITRLECLWCGGAWR